MGGFLWTEEVCLGTCVSGGIKFHGKRGNVGVCLVFPLKLLLISLKSEFTWKVFQRANL